MRSVRFLAGLAVAASPLAAQTVAKPCTPHLEQHGRRIGHYDAGGLHGRSLIRGDLTGPRDRFPDARGRHRSAQFTNTAAAAGVHPLGRKSVLVLTLRSSSNTTRCTNATMNAILFTDKRSDTH